MSGFRLEWRGAFENREMNELHAEAFRHTVSNDDWLGQVTRHSLGWVCARDEADELVGFLNVPWDGACHAFVLDVIVRARARRRGLGTAMVEIATERACEAGCEWLHVDFEPHLKPFYVGACDFTPTDAGLINLGRMTER